MKWRKVSFIALKFVLNLKFWDKLRWILSIKWTFDRDFYKIHILTRRVKQKCFGRELVTNILSLTAQSAHNFNEPIGSKCL